MYLVLVHNGPSKVSSLSEASGIHRTHLYEVLKSLGERGLVEKALETAVYTALPPTEAAKLLLEMQKKELRRLETEVKKIEEAIPKKTFPKNQRHEIFLTSSKTYSFSKSHKYVTSAVSQVDQMQTWKRFAQLWTIFEQTYADITARGVQVRQIVELPADLSQAESFLKRPIFQNSLIEVRFAPKVGGNATIIDNSRMFMSTTREKENLGETPLIFSDYEGLLGLMITYHEYLWRHGSKLVNGRLLDP